MTDSDSAYFSKEGLAKIKAELEAFKTIKRKEIADRLEFAKSLGDLSENSEYQEAKEAQILNESKIAELEDMIRRSVVVEKTSSKEQVGMGSQIILENSAGEKMSFIIVGSNEAAPQENKISNESPMGKAVIGRKKSETIYVQTPKGQVEYKIVDIR